MVIKKNKNSLALKKALKEIDKIYSDTVKKLENLHQKKMKLIKYYHEQENDEQIESVRKSLKNVK